ncbi:hypothetical protein HZZ13_18070 [Bradyrhizobium sp. CNPSo 4010]|uniref:Uncharacterized protein n=1 Tax=Bradyrhizobium agreste TaxID=2751811 RepID=A0ABS0PR35_9BRAD|nr:hypothetical protein [Bradyrhizobium agreste]MBH5399676.1 hypothetical protein [Bradyrhizobium agreste]
MSVIKNPPERADHFYACAGVHPGMPYANIQGRTKGCGEIAQACSHAPGERICKAPIASAALAAARVFAAQAIDSK